MIIYNMNVNICRLLINTIMVHLKFLNFGFKF